LYEIINGLRAAGTDAGSSSAATANFTNGVAFLTQWLYLISLSNHFLLIDFVFIVSATKSVVELLTERVNQLSVKNDNDLVSHGWGVSVCVCGVLVCEVLFGLLPFILFLI
jgi:hypothetical protein